MQLIVMETCPIPEGWTESKYKQFNGVDDDNTSSDSDSDSDTDSEKPDTIRGYSEEKYKKILIVEELLPE